MEKRKQIIDRIMQAIIAESERCVAEGVAEEKDIDTAMYYGALFKKPPFQYLKEIKHNPNKSETEDER